MKSVPLEKDEQTELEVELTASGRNGAIPREGLVGAHAARREPTSRGAVEDQEDITVEIDASAEPTGEGSDVAPTKRAEERERERHRLERALGRTPAGEDGLIHDRRAPHVSRQDLDQAAREADRQVAGHDLRKKS